MHGLLTIIAPIYYYTKFFKQTIKKYGNNCDGLRCALQKCVYNIML